MKKENIDLTFILNPNCEKTDKITLSVKTIASLTISNNPGNQAFFSLVDIEHKILGMFENMLGVDLPRNLRAEIIRLLKTNKSIKEKYIKRYSDNGYFSI